MSDRSFERANRESLDRLTRLVATLTPEQLEVELGDGWTVASSLGHMGFWDRWQAERWQQMLAGEWTADADALLVAEHLANDALHPYWAGEADENLGRLAVDAAAALDALIAGAPDALIDEWLATPSAFLVNRFRHRTEHLDHIERSLAAADSGADRDFVAKNAASRRHLAAVVERLRESDLALPTETTAEGSWNVGQVLGHILFWDLSMETRWRQGLEKAGPDMPAHIDGVPMALTDCINLPLAELLGEWQNRIGLDVGAQAVAAAQRLDALIEVNVGRLASGALSTRPNAAHRSGHREGHLAQIEAALTAARPDTVAVDASYVARNEASLHELEEFLGRLRPADLARPAGELDWTIGQLLGHLAFWDRFLAARWRAALAAGPGSPDAFDHKVSDLLNDGLPASWRAFAEAAPGAVIAEAIAAAREVDGIIATLPAETPVGAILAERPALLDRSLHRLGHLVDLAADPAPTHQMGA